MNTRSSRGGVTPRITLNTRLATRSGARSSTTSRRSKGKQPEVMSLTPPPQPQPQPEQSPKRPAPKTMPIGTRLQDLDRLKRQRRGRREEEDTGHTTAGSELDHIVQHEIYGDDSPPGQILIEMAELLHNNLHRFVVLVSGHLEESDPDQYWTGKSIFTVTESRQAQQQQQQQQQPIGALMAETEDLGDDVFIDKVGGEEEIILQPPQQFVSRQPLRSQVNERRGAKILERMILDGKVNPASLRAWKMLFGRDDKSLMDQVPLLEAKVGELSMETAVRLTLLSPVMVACITAAYDSVRLVAGKSGVSLMNLIMNDSINSKFAELVAAHIRLKKRMNSAFSNKALLRESRVEVKLLQDYFKTLHEDGRGGLFQASSSSFLPRKTGGGGGRYPSYITGARQPSIGQLFPGMDAHRVRY